MVSIRLSFRDGTRSVEGEYEFMVFPGSAEDLVLAKPQLDDLGFRSTKHEVSLEALGISLPAVLPEEHASTLRGEAVYLLKADSHRAVHPPADQWLQTSLRLRQHGSTAALRECAAPLEAGG